jgi:hypothetical protein
MPSFAETFQSFCGELKATFPELTAAVDRTAAQTTAERFLAAWKPYLGILLARDVAALQAERRGLIIGTVQISPQLWGELSENTQNAIWKYLRTLALEAAATVGVEGLETDVMQTLMNIMTAERLETGGAEAETAASEMFEEAMPHLQPLMEKLKGMLGGFMDLSGMSDIPMPTIPEHLRRGRIARLAEEMAKQFDPTEFGIDPALLKSDDVEEVLKRLAEMYQRDPSLILNGAKRVAEKIKKQILGGSLNREELVAEAEEYVRLFKEHPLFKEAIAKFQGLVGENGLASMFGGGGSGGSGGTESERRRVVQERLRKKMEARRGGKK